MGGWWRSGSSTNERTCLGRVLIVDDEESIRQVIRTILTNAGYDVEEADDALLIIFHHLRYPDAENQWNGGDYILSSAVSLCSRDCSDRLP